MVKIIKFETIKKKKKMKKQTKEPDHVIPLVLESIELNIARSLMDRNLNKAKTLEGILEYLKGNNESE